MRLVRRFRAAATLLLVFAYDLVASSLSVARIVLSPSVRTTPAIVAMPVAVTRPSSVALLAYFTSLTPGSTCLHVSDDRRLIYLHLLDAPDQAAAVDKFRRLYERRILELEA